MIKEKTVKINLNAKTIKHYWNLGYSGRTNQIIEIKVEDLTKGSHVKVTAVCKKCDNENEILYKLYLKNIKNGNYYSCHKCCLDKKKQTWLKTLGVDHPSHSTEVRSKSEETNLKKYGKRYYILTDDFIEDENIINKRKKTRLKNGYDIPDSEKDDWELYKSQVRSETNKHKKELFENWNGYDYYDNEYIKDNFDCEARSSNYPTIDHKTSIMFGFENNIMAKKISELKNLCITKKKNNTSKGIRSEKEYKNEKIS